MHCSLHSAEYAAETHWTAMWGCLCSFALRMCVQMLRRGAVDTDGASEMEGHYVHGTFFPIVEMTVMVTETSCSSA